MIVATVIIGISALCRGILLRLVVVAVVAVVPIVAAILPIIIVPVPIMAVATAPGLGFKHRRQSTHANHACRRQTTDNLLNA
jgi:cobalamin biosynthesis protein CobD/CbiB